jgi:hypothetical protein
MKPILIGGAFTPSYSSENLGTSSNQVYYFAFDDVSARQLLDVYIDTIEEYVGSPTLSLTPLGGARFREVNQAAFSFQFRNPVAGQYSNEITYSIGGGVQVRIRIVIYNKLSIYAALSECFITQNVFNDGKFIVKIYESKFEINGEQTFVDKLIGEFETLAFDNSPGDAIGRTFQVKLRVDQIIQQIERMSINDLQEVQSFEKSLLVIPAVWRYEVSKVGESEVYTSGLLYSVNCTNQNNWYQTFTNASLGYPTEAGFTGSLRKGYSLFSNMGNQYEKLFKDNITTTFIFENFIDEYLFFEIQDANGTSLVGDIMFNYSFFNAFDSEMRKLPFFFMYLQQNIAESGLSFNDILGKKFTVFVKNGEGVYLPYTDQFICRKFNGNSYYFNNEPFDGFIYEDSLGGLSELPIELKFNGSFEFETNTAILEKPQNLGAGLEQRIFPIVNNFNFSQEFEASTGYFNSVHLPFYRKILTSKLILFRRRRIFITSASFKNADEPNGLMSIKFTFKFADNNALYDRNYPTC